MSKKEVELVDPLDPWQRFEVFTGAWELGLGLLASVEKEVGRGVQVVVVKRGVLRGQREVILTLVDGGGKFDLVKVVGNKATLVSPRSLTVEVLRSCGEIHPYRVHSSVASQGEVPVEYNFYDALSDYHFFSGRHQIEQRADRVADGGEAELLPFAQLLPRVLDGFDHMLAERRVDDQRLKRFLRSLTAVDRD